jgi:predicted phage replisome organizer
LADITWIKISTSMFDDEKIKLLDAMPENDTIFYVWMRLLVLAGRTNARGYIYISKNISYDDEMLATLFNRKLNSVRFALETLERFKMIERYEDKKLKITNWEKHQNIEGMERIREQNRLRKRKQREHERQRKLLDEAQNNKDNLGIEQNCSNFKHISENKSSNPNYIQFFYNNFGHFISDFEKETLESYIKDGMKPEVITLALQEAVDANARNMGYVKVILNRWLNNKITTIEDVESDKTQFILNSKSKNSKSSKSYYKQGSTFNDFPQRKYDFKVLEKKLLGWNNDE